MIVWLWATVGPQRAEMGVTDEKARAQQLAEASMRAHGAPTATVEEARRRFILASLDMAYQRTGQAWTARCDEDRITWDEICFCDTAPAR